MENKWQMAAINPTLLVIALNVNGLNSPIKSQRLEEQIKKMIQLLTVISTKDTGYKQVEIKRMEKHIPGKQ